MPHIAIISASVRTGRVSHRVALYLTRFLEEQKLATSEILDLNEYQFPVFNERLRFQPQPAVQVLDFADKFRRAEGIIIVTPEYDGGYPASLKNVVDLLSDEWRRKPVAIATVSNGIFGGSQVLISLQFSLWKIRSWTVPATFPSPKAQELFDEQGNAVDKTAIDKRATGFINELLWCIEAKKKMEIGDR